MAQRSAPRRDGRGFVYFIQAGGQQGPIKIGYAHDPLDRLESLQTAHHEELRLLMTIADNGTLEPQLHERFAHLNIRGEWFRAEGDLRDVVWLSGLVPHPDTADELREEERVALAQSRPWPFEFNPTDRSASP